MRDHAESIQRETSHLERCGTIGPDVADTAEGLAGAQFPGGVPAISCAVFVLLFGYMHISVERSLGILPVMLSCLFNQRHGSHYARL